MFSLLDAFGEKPDHPMPDMKEARKLLADLPKDNAFKALEETTFWLASIKDAHGFRPKVRAGIVMLLDETGQPLEAELLHQYLSEPHLQDFHGLHLWQGSTVLREPWPKPIRHASTNTGRRRKSVQLGKQFRLF